MSDTPPQVEAESEAVAEPEPETRYGALLTYSRDQAVVHTDAAGYLALVGRIADDGYHVCVDLTAVDYLFHRERALPAGITAERFEVVVSLLDHADRRRLRVRAQVPEGQPVLASLFDLYPGTEAMEREVYDMFGIAFEGHPDLTRILMPEDWIGHPLRKDYDVGSIPVQFKAASNTR